MNVQANPMATNSVANQPYPGCHTSGILNGQLVSVREAVADIVIIGTQLHSHADLLFGASEPSAYANSARMLIESMPDLPPEGMVDQINQALTDLNAAIVRLEEAARRNMQLV